MACGAADCVLALGFEQMKPGALGAIFDDRPSPFEDFDALADTLVDATGVPLALRYFGGAGLAHMKKYGTKLRPFAKISREGQPARRQQSAGDLPQGGHRRGGDGLTPIWPGVMTRLMACPPTCGAAAAVLVSESFAKQARPGWTCDRGAGDDHRYARSTFDAKRHDARWSATTWRKAAAQPGL